MLARISQWRDWQVKTLKQNIGHISGSIVAVLVRVDFAWGMRLACVMLVRLILKALGL